MKRFIVFLFAVTLVAAWVAPSLAADVTFSGTYRVRAFATNNGSDFNDDAADENTWIDQRFRLGINAAASDDLRGFIQLQMGAPDDSANSCAACVNGSHAFGGPGDFGINVRQAYLDFNLGSVNVKAGKQWFALPSDSQHLVYVDADANNSSDVIVASTQAGPGNVAVGFIKFTEGDAGTAAYDADYNMYFADGSFPVNDNVKLGVFWLFVDNNSGTATTNAGDATAITLDEEQIHYIGVSGSGDFGMVSVNGEGVYMTGDANVAPGGGTDQDIKGYALSAEAKVKANDQITVGLIGGIGSGDDNATDNDRETFMSPSGSYYSGKTGIWWDAGEESNGGVGPTLANTNNVGRGTLQNVTWVSPYIAFSPMDALHLKAQYAWLTQTEKGTTVDDALGQEITLTGVYNIMEGFDAVLQAAWLVPDDGLTGGGTAADDSVSEYFAKIQWDF